MRGSFQLLNSLGERATQHRDAVLVDLALERYRRQNGRWPERREQLTPALLPGGPPDRFDGQPLKDRLREGRPVLYSIGADRRDAGGVPPSDPYAHPWCWLPANRVAEILADEERCGDWVLWPSPKKRK